MTTLFEMLIYVFWEDISLAVQGSEETEIKILKWFLDNLEMIQHYRPHYVDTFLQFLLFPTIIINIAAR